MTAAEEEAAAEVRWHRLLCWERYAPCVYERRSPELPLLRGEHLGYAESLALEAATALGCLTLTCALIVIGATTAYRGSALISAVIAVAAVGGLSAAAVVGLAAIRTVLSLRPLGRRSARSAAPPQSEARLVQPAAPRVSALAALQPPASVALGVINPLSTDRAPPTAAGLRSARMSAPPTAGLRSALDARAAAAPSAWFFLDGLVDATHARQRGPFALAVIDAWCEQGALPACEATLVRQGRTGELVALRVALAAAAVQRAVPGKASARGRANGRLPSRSTGKRAMTSPAQMQLAAARMRLHAGGALGGMSSSVAAAAAAGSMRPLAPVPALSLLPRAWWTAAHVRVGTLVVHPKRGNGTVVALSPDGDGRVHVRFRADGATHRYAERSWLKFFSMHDLFKEALGADDMGLSSADERRTSQRAFMRSSREYSRAAIDAALAAGQPPQLDAYSGMPSEEEEEEVQYDL